jgi:hypothetical protein
MNGPLIADEGGGGRLECKNNLTWGGRISLARASADKVTASADPFRGLASLKPKWTFSDDLIFSYFSRNYMTELLRWEQPRRPLCPGRMVLEMCTQSRHIGLRQEAG